MPVACALAPLTALSAPHGYSVNSDAAMGDSLHRVDLSTGAVTELGQVIGPSETVRVDVEGLAFDKDGSLWAVDDETSSLFKVSTKDGTLLSESIAIAGLTQSSANDFGMTFTCDGSLYVSSATDKTLYLLKTDGTATPLTAGGLGYKVSALAARGNPTQLFALGNGLLRNGSDSYSEDNRSLFSVDAETGIATRIGVLGPAVSPYFEAGLSFAEDGSLWAITDRGELGNSEAVLIDIETGEGQVSSELDGDGFESLAVSPPSGCTPATNGPDTGREASVENIPTLDRSGLALMILMALAAGLLQLGARREAG